MTLPLNGSESAVDLVLMQICVNQVVLMLTSLHFRDKPRKVCIEPKSPPAALSFMGQAAEHTTVKWPVPIHKHLNQNGAETASWLVSCVARSETVRSLF